MLTRDQQHAHGPAASGEAEGAMLLQSLLLFRAAYPAGGPPET